MTRWPGRRVPVPEEPPAWVRSCVLEDWREPDKWERQMVDGCGGWLPQSALDWHAYRRWNAAVNDWYRAHPAAAAEWLRECIASLGVPE